MGLFKNLLGTTLDQFKLGRGTAGDKSLVANTDASDKPQLRYNDTSKKWEVSNDGLVFVEIPTSSGGLTQAQVLARTLGS